MFGNSFRNYASSLSKVVDHVNIMAYDMGHSDLLNNKVYKNVLNTFAQRVDRSKINLGFEPGGQDAGGVWEGFDIDK